MWQHSSRLLTTHETDLVAQKVLKQLKPVLLRFLEQSLGSSLRTCLCESQEEQLLG